jgi:type II secretory ATPase GspE/PulE/Tfp pilus assembly ATPase PilB-like protein
MLSRDIAERRNRHGKINFRVFDPQIVELRIATMPRSGSLDVVIRILHTGDPLPMKPGFTERNKQVFEKAITKPYGLILAGPPARGRQHLHSALH